MNTQIKSYILLGMRAVNCPGNLYHICLFRTQIFAFPTHTLSHTDRYSILKHTDYLAIGLILCQARLIPGKSAERVCGEFSVLENGIKGGPLGGLGLEGRLKFAPINFGLLNNFCLVMISDVVCTLSLSLAFVSRVKRYP